jgi:hypothetical protein
MMTAETVAETLDANSIFTYLVTREEFITSITVLLKNCARCSKVTYLLKIWRNKIRMTNQAEDLLRQ